MSRSGYTLLEIFIVLTMSALVLAVALPRTATLLDRIAAQSAAGDVAATLGAARTLAMAARAAIAVDIDSASGVLRVRRGPEVLFTRGVGSAHAVRLRGTRDSLSFDPRGLGRGAANLSVIVTRGSAAETVFVSRLGRVR